MKQFITIICLALIAGCQPAIRDSAVHKETPQPISEQEARQIASDHVNAFLKDKTFTTIHGTEQPYPGFPPTAWHNAQQTTDGWSLACEPPAGPYAHVQMDPKGKNAKVTRYGFSAE